MADSPSSALWRGGSFGPLLVVPVAILLGGLLAYPLGLGVWLGFKDAKIGSPGSFIGFENYQYLLEDPGFPLPLVKSALYTVITVILKLALGLALALVLNQKFAGVRFWRSVLLLPYVVPTGLSAFAWWWIFDPQFSFISWSLVRLGLLKTNIDFLGDSWLARMSLMIANILRRAPFFPPGYPSWLHTVF